MTPIQNQGIVVACNLLAVLVIMLIHRAGFGRTAAILTLAWIVQFAYIVVYKGIVRHELFHFEAPTDYGCHTKGFSGRPLQFEYSGDNTRFQCGRESKEGYCGSCGGMSEGFQYDKYDRIKPDYDYETLAQTGTDTQPFVLGPPQKRTPLNPYRESSCSSCA